MPEDILIHEALSVEMLRQDPDFWAIYHGSFPPEETESEAVIYRSLENGGRAFRSRLNGKTVAMATTQDLKNPGALFLIYLAVNPTVRGKSLGSKLIEWIWSDVVMKHPEMQGMVWEVDRTEDAADSAGREIREKRLRFFDHHGGKILSYPYRQPALDGVKPVPMNLLFRSKDITLPHPQELTRAIYFEKYGAINGIRKAHLEGLLDGKSVRDLPDAK